jgi:1-acyl-sn-glycerol-3-phosphate acyltransferase
MPARPAAGDDLPEIPANKNWLGDALIYRFLVRYPLWSAFSRVAAQIEGELPLANDGPLIVYLNHPSWWDGYLCFVIDRILLRSRFDSYLMMEDLQLRSYRFFTWSGAFSVDRTRAESAARSLRYIAALLGREQPSSLFIFPQGTISPNDQRPLRLYRGAAQIAAQLNREVSFLPVALRYEFGKEQRPEALMRIGPAHRVAPPLHATALTRELQQRLSQNCDQLRDDFLEGRTASYPTIVHGRTGINRLFDRFLARILPRSASD